jgi:hypothetical protein
LIVGAIIVTRGKVLIFILPVFFTSYLIYGFIRPRISGRMRRGIEEEEEEEDGPRAV